MNGFVRRVVTGHDKNGKAIVLSDGLTPTLKQQFAQSGQTQT
jgi:hypothetical protein